MDRLWTPPNEDHPPVDLYPVGLLNYNFFRPDGQELLIPWGGTTYDGRVRLLGMDAYPSEDMPPEACAIKKMGSRGKQHVVYLSDLPSDNTAVVAVCGNSIKRWERLSHDEEIIMICAKTEYAEGGTWCWSCIKTLRKVFEDANPSGKGRATHIYLAPMSQEAAATLPPSQRDSATYLMGTVDAHEYSDPKYICCNQCRQPYHLGRGETTDEDNSRPSISECGD